MSGNLPPSLVDRRGLQQMPDLRSFERGEAYFLEGRVGCIAGCQGTISATVRGRERYGVVLWVEEERLAHSCSCPVGVDGGFCKHCVALALAWLDYGAWISSRKPAETAIASGEVQSYLTSLHKKKKVISPSQDC